MSLQTFFSKIKNSLTPVYDVGNAAENVILYFPVEDGFQYASIGNQFRPMVYPDETNYNTVQNALISGLGTGNTGAISIFNRTFDHMLDMTSWILTAAPKIIGFITVGVGNTVTVDCQVIASIKKTGYPDDVLYNTTLSLSALIANSNLVFPFSSIGINRILQQNAKISIQVILTATRTAGASNCTVAMTMAPSAYSVTSCFTFRKKTDLSFSDYFFGTRRTS